MCCVYICENIGCTVQQISLTLFKIRNTLNIDTHLFLTFILCEYGNIYRLYTLVHTLRKRIDSATKRRQDEDVNVIFDYIDGVAEFDLFLLFSFFFGAGTVFFI